MTNVLVVGASGQISLETTQLLLDNTTANVTLFLRTPQKLPDYNNHRVTIIEGDATDEHRLNYALENIDVVFASLAGGVDAQAESIISAMRNQGVKRLIFVTALGIYNEVKGVFGEWNNAHIGPALPPYQRAAEAIENSDLDYTILRPAWLTNADEIAYETTQKGEDFKGTEVSRKSVAALAVDIIQNPNKHVRESLGVNKPNTDGDKPSWM